MTPCKTSSMGNAWFSNQNTNVTDRAVPYNSVNLLVANMTRTLPSQSMNIQLQHHIPQHLINSGAQSKWVTTDFMSSDQG